MLNNPRLQRHAAYALCNQAGNKKSLYLLLFLFLMFVGGAM